MCTFKGWLTLLTQMCCCCFWANGLSGHFLIGPEVGLSECLQGLRLQRSSSSAPSASQELKWKQRPQGTVALTLRKAGACVLSLSHSLVHSYGASVPA